jgi:hypothetical protein
MPKRTPRQCADHYINLRCKPAGDVADVWTKRNQILFFQLKVAHCKGTRVPKWDNVARDMSSRLGTPLSVEDCKIKNKRIVKRLTRHGMFAGASVVEQLAYMERNPGAMETAEDRYLQALHAWAAAEGFGFLVSDNSGPAADQARHLAELMVTGQADMAAPGPDTACAGTARYATAAVVGAEDAGGVRSGAGGVAADARSVATLGNIAAAGHIEGSRRAECESPSDAEPRSYLQGSYLQPSRVAVAADSPAGPHSRRAPSRALLGVHPAVKERRRARLAILWQQGRLQAHESVMRVAREQMAALALSAAVSAGAGTMPKLKRELRGAARGLDMASASARSKARRRKRVPVHETLEEENQELHAAIAAQAAAAKQTMSCEKEAKGAPTTPSTGARSSRRQRSAPHRFIH